MSGLLCASAPSVIVLHMQKSAPAALGAKLRHIRTDLYMTIDALSKTSGVSVRTIIDIEQGRANPRLSAIEALAAALDVPVVDLIAAEA